MVTSTCVLVQSPSVINPTTFIIFLVKSVEVHQIQLASIMILAWSTSEFLRFWLVPHIDRMAVAALFAVARDGPPHEEATGDLVGLATRQQRDAFGEDLRPFVQRAQRVQRVQRVPEKGWDDGSDLT